MVPSSLAVFKCPNCDKLKSKILEQISAFRVLAKVNAALSWTILAENIEGLIIKEGDEIIEVSSEHRFDQDDEEQQIIEDTRQENVSDEVFMTADDPLEEENVDEIIENDQIQDIGDPVDNSDNALTAAKLEAANEFIRRKPVTGKKKRFEYECLICHRCMTSQRDTRLHIRRVHFNDRFQCIVCHTQFYDRRRNNRCASCMVIPDEPKTKERQKKRILKRKKLTRKKLRRKYKQKVAYQDDQQCEFNNNNNNNNDYPEQENGRMKYEKNDGQIDMTIKHEVAFDMEMLVVTNPFENFSLQRALSAQVQLDRIDCSGDQPPVPSFDLVAATTSALDEYNSVPKDDSETVKKKSEKQKYPSNASKSLEKPTLSHSLPGPRRTISKRRKVVKRKNFTRSKSGRKNKFAMTNKKKKTQEIDPLKEEIVMDESINLLAMCESVLLTRNDDDDLKLENSKLDPSQYQDLPQLTVNHYNTDDGYENDMTSDMPSLSPPLLTPVNLRQEPVIKCENGDEILPVVVNNDDADDDDDEIESERNSLVPFNPSNQLPEVSGERASLDQVDTIIVAKVDLSNKNGGVTFHCTLCPKIYKDVTTIRRHVRLVHFMERKPCGVCGKNFYDHTRRRKHEEKCTGKD